MLKFVGRRVLWLIPVMLGAIFIVFAINAIDPGDPVSALLGGSYTQEQYDDKKIELGLDKPFIVRYAGYVKDIVTDGDFGTSYTTKRPVSTELVERFGVTFKVAVISILIAIVLGLPFGIISAVKQYSIADNAVTIISLVFASMPGFWLALMLMLAFALNIKIFPASGIEGWKSWVLPCLASGLSFIATITRMTRSSMLDVVRQDYIRTARAKGLDERTVIVKHGVRNALIPIITTIGFQFGILVSGSVIVETIFSLPGLGTLMMTAINNRDYPVIEGCVIIMAALICVINLLVDLVYGFVDPQIMEQMKGSKKARRARHKTMGAHAL
ncbi:MAG: ABC transporter permease [Clostridiales Family XIII bacterium]|jgi:peptide/nickel transport system permease protein|nr:ABC transporter permease [Clostridiales Family XIII bacterium]